MFGSGGFSMVTRRKIRRRKARQQAREGLYRNRLYFISCKPTVFYYANIDYMTPIQWNVDSNKSGVIIDSAFNPKE